MPKAPVQISEHARLKKRLENIKIKGKFTSKLKKMHKRRGDNMDGNELVELNKTASDTLDALDRLEKKSFVPGSEVGGGGGAVDPMTGLPVDPATGMPIDPATGMPIDPAMLEQLMGGGGGMPPGMPMGPAMGGMPPGVPMDPSMGGMPPGMPADPSMGGGPEGGGASPDDMAILEERLKSLEDVVQELVGVLETQGSQVDKSAAGEPVGMSQGDPAVDMGQPAMPGPYGSGANDVLATINPDPDATTGELIRTLNKLSGR